MGSAQKGHKRLLLNFHSCRFCGCVLQHFKWQITHVFACGKHGRPCADREVESKMGIVAEFTQRKQLLFLSTRFVDLLKNWFVILPPTVVLNTCDIFQGVVQVRLDFTREGAEKLNPALSCFLRRGLCQGNLGPACTNHSPTHFATYEHPGRAMVERTKDLRGVSAAYCLMLLAIFLCQGTPG